MNGHSEESSRNIQILDIEENKKVGVLSDHIQKYNKYMIGGTVIGIIDNKLVFCGGFSSANKRSKTNQVLCVPS